MCRTIFPNRTHTRLSIAILVFAAMIGSCKKEDLGPVHNIVATLYSLQTNVSDPGDNCELYGHIFSYPITGGNLVQHDHFQHTEGSYFEIGLNAMHEFAETPITVKKWSEVGEGSKLVIRIELIEDDVDIVDEDDVFGIQNFEIPVSEILDHIDPLSGYYEKAGMTVYSGTESISISFRFSIE